MSIAQTFLPEFDQEMATTRRVLERVPEDKLSFKPDPRSMSLARLAGHVAELPIWGSVTVNRDELDLASGEFKATEAASRDQLLTEFDKIVAETRAAIAGASDDHLMKPWALKMAGNVIFSMSRVAVLRSFVMNHLIHHRGQLSVYLRMTGAPVPSIYGPSADEGQMGG